MLIVEFVFATHCILTQGQVKPELPDSHQLLHRNIIIATGILSFAKSTITRLPIGRYVPTLRSDRIFLSFGSIVRPNYLMLLFWEGTIVTCIVQGGQKYQHDDILGSCTSIHCISTSFPPTYNTRWLIDATFHALAAKVGEFTSIALFRWGRGHISRGADSKNQYWYWTITNHN